jgi:hypothetical protein
MTTSKGAGMKTCNNCFEQNTDGATHCVICGEALPVIQVVEEEHPDTIKEVETPKEVVPPPVVMADPAGGLLLVGTDTLGASPQVKEPVAEELVQAAIEVYHATEPRLLYTHPIVNDITLVGREDPQRDVFPDLDLSKIPDVVFNCVSREHLRVLRQENQFFVFIYRGSTGTQINKDAIPEADYGKKIEIHLGDRIILGGLVRLKLIKLS